MILGWDLTAAMPYLAGHLGSDLAAFGNFQVVASTNVTNRLVAGSADHQFVSHVRIVINRRHLGTRRLGCLLRWRSNSPSDAGVRRRRFGFRPQDVTLLLLVIAPVLLVIAQPYGGEMAMRYYLFTSADRVVLRRRRLSHARHVPRAGYRVACRVGSRPGRCRSAPAAVVVTCLLLLGGFMFARYGNESADYVTSNEANAVAYLYSVAPTQSLLLAGWAGTPWRYQDLEQYTYSQLYVGTVRRRL